MTNTLRLLTLSLLTLVGCSCTTTRQMRTPESVPATGKAEKTRNDKGLDYSGAVQISAPPEVVWAVMTDAAGFTKWNSTIVSLDGKIAKDEKIKLVSKVAKDRTFELKVTTFDEPKQMVWEDGNSMFLGVRHFTLLPADGGTTLVMSETYSGGMLGMIEGSLPDMTENFNTFLGDAKREAERRAATP